LNPSTTPTPLNPQLVPRNVTLEDPKEDPTIPWDGSGSLWASENDPGARARLAAGIGAGFGVVLIVFLAVVLRQWRRGRRGDVHKQEEEEVEGIESGAGLEAREEGGVKPKEVGLSGCQLLGRVVGEGKREGGK
jgi:hypothetical protein